MPTFTKSPPELVDRFAAVLGQGPDVEQRQMFGYPAAFVGGNMVTSLHNDRWVVRLPPEATSELLAIDGAGRFEPLHARPPDERVLDAARRGSSPTMRHSAGGSIAPSPSSTRCRRSPRRPPRRRRRRRPAHRRPRPLGGCTRVGSRRSPGVEATFVLPSGRAVEYWEGGDPAGRGHDLPPGHAGHAGVGSMGPPMPLLAAGVRLISVNRPGYGGPTMAPSVPSLLAVGRRHRRCSPPISVWTGTRSSGARVEGRSPSRPPSPTRVRVRALGVGGRHRAVALARPAVGQPGGSCDASPSWTREMWPARWACMHRAVRGRTGRPRARRRCRRCSVRRCELLDPRRADIARSGPTTCGVVLDNLDGYTFDNLAGAAPGTWTRARSSLRACCGTETLDEHCPLCPRAVVRRPDRELTS